MIGTICSIRAEMIRMTYMRTRERRYEDNVLIPCKPNATYLLWAVQGN